MGNDEESGNKAFSSFEALRRAHSDEPVAPKVEPTEDKGWVVETQAGEMLELTDEELAKLPPLEPNVPKRIS